ncbi:MAG: GAF domain-containing protein [Cyanobacteria bacterium J06639_14]
MLTSLSTVVDSAMSVKLSDAQIQALQAQVAELEADNQHLRQSESRYRQVFENAPISMMLLNREGYVTAMNAAAGDLYGLTVEQFNQNACPIFDNSQLIENDTLSYMQRALAGEAVIEPPSCYDTSRDLDSGVFHHARGHYAPIRNAAGVVEGFVEIAPQYDDFFEQLLEEKERAAQERARLLATVAEVANRLLRAPDYEAVLPEVVRLLGEATGCDRCAITQDFIDSTTHQFRVRLLHEWCRDEIPSALIISPGFEEGLEIDSPPSFRSQLLQGESINFVVSEMAELSWQHFFEAHGNTAMLLVPVMIDGHCWGHVGFDNCGKPRLHDAAEIAILQVAAESIAAAIERQEKDDALQESERRFQELFESSNDGIYFSNFNQPIPLSLPIEEQIDLAYQSFQFVNVNSACANMFGFDRPDEMIGKYLGNVHSPNSNHRNLLRHLSQNGWNVSNLESDDVDEQGNKRYWLSHLFSTIEDGHLVRGWGIANNITELRQAQQALLAAEQAKSQELERLNAQLRESERRYRTLFELSNEGIYRFEFEEPIALALSVEERVRLGYRVNRLVEVNQAVAEQYGCTSPDEIVGTRLGDFYDEAYAQANDQANLTLMRDLRVSDLETVETDRLGHRHWFITSLVCEACDGYIVGGWGVQTDITELKQAQQALLAAEQAKSQELESLNAELRQTLTELEGRDRISEATVAATNALLTTNTLLTTEKLDDAVNTALQIIGEALHIDRVAVLEHFASLPGSSLPGWRTLYEWDAAGTVAQLAHAQSAQGTYEGIEDWYEQLSQGQVISCLLEDMPEPFRSGQAAINVQALHTVPIFIDGTFWGSIGIDNCREAKRISEAELAVLSVAADCIGSAIQRERLRLAEQRTQQTLRQAETARAAEQARNEVLQQRDRLLNASATSVSALLTVENLDDAINRVLKTVGEALDTDRAGVIEFFYPDERSSAGLPHWRSLYEWHTPDTPSQLADPTANQGTHDGIEDIYARLEQGNFFSAAIEDCGEPFRTQQLAIDVQAIHYVPIFVESECWGILTFDNCREVKHRSPAELSVFSIAADCVGSAIQRQRTQQTLQRTEQARAVEQARNEVLQQRDRMLSTVAAATKDLLDSSNTDLAETISAALRVLGEGLRCDRVNVLENFDQSATQVPGHTKVIYGWAEPDTVTQLPHPDATQIDGEGLEAFTGQYLQNNGFGGLVDDWPEPLRSAFKAIGMQSSYSVPIWLGEKFWGIVAFDYCHEAKQVSPAEMAILRTAAACIGGAIQRDRTQKAILQTEQAQVAKLMKTNQALKNNLDRLAAESSLDAFLGHVLTEISQQLNIQTIWFYLYESIDQTLQLHRWVEQGEVQPPESFVQLGPVANPIAVANLPIWAHLQQTRTPFVITADNADQAEQFMFPGTQDWQLQWAKQNNIQSSINILLMVGETPLGLLGLLSAQRSEYTSEELALVQALAHQATLAMQLTRLADEAKQATLYEERSRLAGEIHDTLAQTFTGISVQLELAQYLIGQSAKENARAEVDSTLERISSLAQTGLAEARRSVWSLYPATEDYANLAEPLADCIAALARGTELHTQVSLKGEPYSVNCFVGKNLVRIGQEAITNTFRHAQATELWVELTYTTHQVSLRVSDNGCGFVPQAQAEGFGLVSISERADRMGGQLRITTHLGQGTEIFVQVPL